MNSGKYNAKQQNNDLIKCVYANCCECVLTGENIFPKNLNKIHGLFPIQLHRLLKFWYGVLVRKCSFFPLEVTANCCLHLF